MDIHDPCIIGLDLMTCWGAVVDTAKATITIGSETIMLQTGRSSRKRRKLQQATQSSLAAAAEESSPKAWPPATSETPLLLQSTEGSAETTIQPATAQHSAETVPAVLDLWKHSSNDLKDLLEGNTDLFAARDEDCGQTALVQHSIDTGSAQPNRLRPHCLSLNKRQVMDEMV